LTQIEEQIVDYLSRSDQKAIALLYDHYADTLFGVVMKITKNDEDLSKDILQEAFVNIWKYAKKYDSGKGRLFTWILNITRNKALDKLRSLNRKPEIQDFDFSVYDHDGGGYSYGEDWMDIRKQVAKLDSEKRILIEHAYFLGFTQKEISENLDIPLGTVKTRMRAAMKELRSIFGE
jgi:RNA polymerase sigma-70 factor (ECF subfamily)